MALDAAVAVLEPEPIATLFAYFAAALVPMAKLSAPVAFAVKPIATAFVLSDVALAPMATDCKPVAVAR